MIWMLKKGAYRVSQGFMKLLASNLRFREPELLTGKGCSKDLAKVVRAKGIDNVLIITDKVLMNLGKLNGFFESLDINKIRYTVYDDVKPNPTIDSIEMAKKIYLDNSCQGIIAFGGGSPIDCAKIAAARATNKDLSVRQMKGVLKIKKILPPLFAVPTTAGTGSETTIAAVVTDAETHEKYAIMDLKLIPVAAALDPELTIELPKHITSTTGMDALTHAIEAYIGRNGTDYTDKNAEEAVRIIFSNLETVYNNGSNLEARNQMLLASYKAGTAFTRAYVGYVHAIAHTLGGLYGVAHGLANSIVLPYVLEYYGNSIKNKLSKLAIVAGIGSSEDEDDYLAHLIIERIKQMNKNMDIPLGIKEIKEKDIPLIVKRVLKESNPGYPVPRIMNEKECTEIIRKLLIN